MPVEDTALGIENMDEEANECPPLEDQGEDVSDDEGGDDSVAEPDEEEEAVPIKPEPEVRRSGCISAGVKQPKRHAMMTEGTEQSKRASKTKAAEVAEIKKVFEELQALEPVERTDLPRNVKALGSHLFTAEKFMADGQHDKFKSCLVSHGNEQDSTLYPDRSSPMAAVHTIMMVLMVAACNRDYLMGKLDVKGAFIQTEMKGTLGYIKCRGKLKDLILEAYPEYGKYVGADRILYCKLKKALYGCIQASKLWYEKLRSFLCKQGYVCSKVDLCLFRRIVGNDVYLLVVYIDDGLVVAKRSELAILRNSFTKEFRWVTMVDGDTQSYLGMLLTVRGGVVEIDMRYYLGKILSEHDNLPVVACPGAKNSFMVDEESPALDDAQKKAFHTSVAKLLYLFKRARSDVILVVGFLCTRVKGPTEEDLKKLKRVLGYLKGTKGWIMKMEPKGVFCVEAYVDASCSAHPDGKSHSGAVVRVGGAYVFFGSKKQKCVSKSPTEAELVALSDNVGFVELFGELVDLS
jgi:hypothetical protein